MSSTNKTPLDWEKRINGNAPDEPEVTPIFGGHVPTSATKWKKVEVALEEVPQNEERMNKFQRENKRRKEGR